MPTRVVAISHTTGSGGESIGRIVAERLGFRYVDEEIVAWAAQKTGVEPDLVADAEGRKGLLARFVEGLGKTGVDAGGIGFSVTLPELSTSEDFHALIGEAIRETAERGEVVIVAHAASIALAGRRDLVRVLVTASPEARAQRLADSGHVDKADAGRSVQRSDTARADYLKRFYRIDRELPTHYDLVVSTDVLKVDAAADIVLCAARP
jgi:cytidylate kinase